MTIVQRGGGGKQDLHGPTPCDAAGEMSAGRDLGSGKRGGSVGRVLGPGFRGGSCVLEPTGGKRTCMQGKASVFFDLHIFCDFCEAQLTVEPQTSTTGDVSPRVPTQPSAFNVKLARVRRVVSTDLQFCREAAPAAPTHHHHRGCSRRNELGSVSVGHLSAKRSACSRIDKTINEPVVTECNGCQCVASKESSLNPGERLVIGFVRKFDLWNRKRTLSSSDPCPF